MGRYMRKCRGIGELAVMEVSQVVGVRTRAMTTALAQAARAAKRRKAVGSTVTAEYQIAYLQLRSRSLVMTKPRVSRSGVGISGSRRCLTPDHGEISRCESNASCEVADLCSDEPEVDEDSGSAMHHTSFRRESRERTPLSTPRDESYGLKSTAERRSSRRSTAELMPSDAEIEEFFAAEEKKETQLFVSMYNYDVVNDVPLEGRYEWVQVSPP